MFLCIKYLATNLFFKIFLILNFQNFTTSILNTEQAGLAGK